MASAQPIQGRICVAESEALDMGMNDRACGEIDKLLGILRLRLATEQTTRSPHNRE